MEDNLFQGLGMVSGWFSMIYCALHVSYYYIGSTWSHQSLDPGAGHPCPVLYRGFSLVACFIHSANSVYTSLPISPFPFLLRPSRLSPLVELEAVPVSQQPSGVLCSQLLPPLSVSKSALSLTWCLFCPVVRTSPSMPGDVLCLISLLTPQPWSVPSAHPISLALKLQVQAELLPLSVSCLSPTASRIKSASWPFSSPPRPCCFFSRLGKRRNVYVDIVPIWGPDVVMSM